MHAARELFAGSEVMRRERQRLFANLRSGTRTLDETPPEFFTTWTELMLTAFGIECLIKAIWIKQGNQLARDGRYVPMTKNEHHDLVRLCGVAGIALDQCEINALNQISDIAGSIGRYPIARTASLTEGVRSWSSEDDEVIGNLIVRLKKELEND
jgi:hypothetical protein